MSVNTKVEQWPSIQPEAMTAPEMPSDWLRRLGATSLVYEALAVQAADPIIRLEGVQLESELAAIRALTSSQPQPAAAAISTPVFGRHGADVSSTLSSKVTKRLPRGWQQ